MSNLKFKNNYLNTKFYIFFLFCFSLLISLILHSSFDQRAIDAALYLSKNINSIDENNILNLVHANSYTIAYQILDIFLRFNFSKGFLNFFLIFLSILINSTGIFLIARSITSDHILSFFIAILAVISTLNFGSLDYPVLIISEHTNGMIGSALPVLIFGLVGNKNFKLAFLFCLVNISFHVVIGIWISFITLISFYIFKKEIFSIFFKSKKNIFFLIFILFIFLVSIMYFQATKVIIPFEHDKNLFETYMSVWEHHRSNSLKINYVYILLSIILFLTLFCTIKFKSEKLNQGSILMFKLLGVHLILSFIIYIIYKVSPDFFHQKIINLMPSRFFLLHSFLGLYVLLSIILFFILNLNNRKNIFLIIFFTTFLFNSVIYAEKSPMLKYFYAKFILKKENKDDKFWDKLRSQKINGYVLTSVNICSKALQEVRRPLLICLESIDYLPYMPNLVKPINKIITEIYEIDFHDPPEKNHGGIWYDNSYKFIFENRTKEKWRKISKQFNLSGLILPSSWQLNLDKTLIGKNYTYYRL